MVDAVVVTVATVDIGEAVVVVDKVVVELDAAVEVRGVVVKEVDVLTELQDASSNDVTKKRLSVTKIVPLFM